LAGVKLSGSPNKLGLIKVRRINNIIIIINPNKSFIEKYGWNGILSKLLLIPRGLFEPV
jgi:hypothetical protein